MYPQALFYKHCSSCPEQELCNSQRDCCHHLMLRTAQQAIVLQASLNLKPIQCLAEITPSVHFYGHLSLRLSSGHCVVQKGFFNSCRHVFVYSIMPIPLLSLWSSSSCHPICMVTVTRFSPFWSLWHIETLDADMLNVFNQNLARLQWEKNDRPSC